MSWKRSFDSSPPVRTGTASRRSPLKETSVFELFSPPLVQALKERGFSSPTDPQVRLVPIVTEGKNALLMAPTGTGKTEAAILPIIDKLIREGATRPRGTKLLYVTPLRALNRDMLERMQWWCKRFDIRLGVRHGDSSQAERTNLSLAPPDKHNVGAGIDEAARDSQSQSAAPAGDQRGFIIQPEYISHATHRTSRLAIR